MKLYTLLSPTSLSAGDHTYTFKFPVEANKLDTLNFYVIRSAGTGTLSTVSYTLKNGAGVAILPAVTWSTIGTTDAQETDVPVGPEIDVDLTVTTAAGTFAIYALVKES